ncbi:ATP synthase subunit g, mitochondrial-like [Danaus plexippus]|uniref:ATP synthase subunit g, mitochondrial-like n=1 Tax=Danaus plexippus TaxID=13037 RepID=UPI002AB2C063|nr:ATP synthase subunit g, mitochondrial-like [Danaus plexippus]
MTTKTKSVKVGIRYLRTRSALFSEIANVYRPALKHREEVLELIKEKYSKALQSRFADKMRTAKGFYRLEMSVPKVEEMKRIQEDLALVKDFIKNECYKQITVKQAWLLFLVGLEIGLWFFLGETIGKFHIVGYKV